MAPGGAFMLPSILSGDDSGETLVSLAISNA